MKKPLYEALMEYSTTKIPFHMPGHKFGQAGNLNQLDLYRLDNTEALGMDNLYEAEGIIKEAMDLMADFYGAKETIFLTNGSTSGILSTLLATCKEGDQFIVARNAHHSVWSALILAGITPIYVSPTYIETDDLLGEINASTIKEAIQRYPNVKGAIIVSPTYEGIVSDITTIAEILHKEDKILIVDEAHGAHFGINEIFPTSSIQLGADLVINSLHKTLPALTQSALVHVCTERIGSNEIINSLRMVQTSSPSYVMMGVMDYMRVYLLENKKLIEEHYIQPLVKLRNELKELNYLKLIDKPRVRYDIGKIIISTLHANIDGYELANRLNSEFKITVEAALSNYIILMTTVADNEITLGLLERALRHIDSTLSYSLDIKKQVTFQNNEITKGVNPRTIYHSEKTWIELKQGKDKVVARNIMLYPPGIPILCVGETLTEEYIHLLDELKDKLQGVKREQGTIKIETLKNF